GSRCRFRSPQARRLHRPPHAKQRCPSDAASAFPIPHSRFPIPGLLMLLPATSPFDLNPAQATPRADIEKAARELETQFAQMLIKSMRSASPDGGLGGDTRYRDMYDQQLARELGKGRGLGLAPMIMRQLERSTGAATEASTGALPLRGTGAPAAAMPLAPATTMPAMLPLAPTAAMPGMLQ